MGISMSSAHIQKLELETEICCSFFKKKLFTKNVQDVNMFHRTPSLISTIHHIGRHFVLHVLK